MTLSLVLHCQREVLERESSSRSDLHHVDNGSPTTEGIAVDGVQKSLGDGLKEVLGRKVGLPQSLGGTVELVGGRSGDSKVLGCSDAPDASECVRTSTTC